MYYAVWGFGNTMSEAGVLSTHDTFEAAASAAAEWLRGEDNPAVGAWARAATTEEST